MIDSSCAPGPWVGPAKLLRFVRKTNRTRRPHHCQGRRSQPSGQHACLRPHRGDIHVQTRGRRNQGGPDTRHELKEPVLAHQPMRRERREVCNIAAGSSAPAQRCAGSRARMSHQKAASAGAQHVCRFATRLLLRVALLLSFSCTGSVVGVAPTRRSKLRPWYAWPEINPFQKDKPPAGFMITTHKVGDGAVQELMIPSTS